MMLTWSFWSWCDSFTSFSSRQVFWSWPWVWDLALWFLSASVYATSSTDHLRSSLKTSTPLQLYPQTQLIAQGLAQSRSTWMLKIKEERHQPLRDYSRLSYRTIRCHPPQEFLVPHESFLFINIFIILLYLFINTLIAITMCQALL